MLLPLTGRKNEKRNGDAGSARGAAALMSYLQI
jgi:hypothetical protein